jgi:GT2 family glycosyltransferase
MVSISEPSVIDSDGIRLDRAGVAWDGNGGVSVELAEALFEPFGACAGAAMYRRELFHDVGLFDEDFFMYLEDVDLAWRARLAGWRCVFAQDARVLHHHSATAGEHSPFKLYHLGRNKIWLIAKNYPAFDLFAYLPLILAVESGATLVNLIGRRSGLSWRARAAAMRGRLDAIAGLPSALSKRQDVQRRRRVPRWRVASLQGSVSWPWQYLARYAYLSPKH